MRMDRGWSDCLSINGNVLLEATWRIEAWRGRRLSLPSPTSPYEPLPIRGRARSCA